MTLPGGVWLTITSYRDFWDVPRFMLVADPASGYWILDGGFVEELDDYPPDYTIYFAGIEPDQANAAFIAHAHGQTGAVMGTVPVERFEFDPTRRKELLLKQSP